MWFLIDPSRNIVDRGTGLNSEEPLAALELLSGLRARLLFQSHPLTVRTSIEAFERAREELVKLIREKNCGPLLFRLAWHDAGTFSLEDGTGGKSYFFHLVINSN